MTTYKIGFSSIPACQKVEVEGKMFSAIGGCEGSKTEFYPEGNLSKDLWNTLPVEVQSSINRNFGAVFSLPVGRRLEFVKSFQPYTIEV